MTRTQNQKGNVPLYERPKINGVAIPYQGQSAREGYEAVLELRKKYSNTPQAHWIYDEKTEGIQGSSLRDLILLNEHLKKSRQRTLTFEEGMGLDERKLLSNGVYRDFGAVLYSDGNPNSEIAKGLAEQTKGRWHLPVIAHPSSLKLGDSGIEILFGDDDQFIIHGEEAIEALNRLNYLGSSGVCRLGRGTDGDWLAVWGNLAGSDSGGRVDFVRGEAATQKVNDTVLAEINTAHELAAKQLAERKQRAITAAREILYGK